MPAECARIGVFGNGPFRKIIITYKVGPPRRSPGTIVSVCQVIVLPPLPVSHFGHQQLIFSIAIYIWIHVIRLSITIYIWVYFIWFSITIYIWVNAIWFSITIYI